MDTNNNVDKVELLLVKPFLLKGLLISAMRLTSYGAKYWLLNGKERLRAAMHEFQELFAA
jgi:hypothetical protein